MLAAILALGCLLAANALHQGELEFRVKVRCLQHLHYLQVRCGFAGTPVRIPQIACVNPMNISYFHIGNRRAY
jgi:hypothetical protein